MSDVTYAIFSVKTNKAIPEQNPKFTSDVEVI